MLIGGNFNKKSRLFLKELATVSGGEVGVKVSVAELVSDLELDKTELKSIIEYLEALECISVETIGGTHLYGHVSITRKGLEKTGK